MFTYPIYKQLKTHLAAICPVFYFTGQYLRGKENTSYKVPAIYIEVPKSQALGFLGRKLMRSKDARFKVHYISNAPFNQADNSIQDSAIAAHENQVAEIDKLVTGWNAADTSGNLLSQQFIPVNGTVNQFTQGKIYSVIEYSTEVLSRHLRT